MKQLKGHLYVFQYFFGVINAKNAFQAGIVFCHKKYANKIKNKTSKAHNYFFGDGDLTDATRNM